MTRCWTDTFWAAATEFVGGAVGQHLAECSEWRERWVGLKELRAALDAVAAQR
jgi:hypothetical protein